MAKVIVNNETSWDGRFATKFITLNGNGYKIKAAKTNGSTYKVIYRFTDNGWKEFVTADDLGIEIPNDVSYVSKEELRKEWAENVVDTLETALKNMNVTF